MQNMSREKHKRPWVLRRVKLIWGNVHKRHIRRALREAQERGGNQLRRRRFRVLMLVFIKEVLPPLRGFARACGIQLSGTRIRACGISYPVIAVILTGIFRLALRAIRQQKPLLRAHTAV